MLRAPANHIGVSVSVSIVTSSCFEAPHGPIFSSRWEIEANISEAAPMQTTADEWE
jgi:hypothetical protein